MSQRWTVGIICVLLGIFTGISSGVIDKFLTSKTTEYFFIPQRHELLLRLVKLILAVIFSLKQLRIVLWERQMYPIQHTYFRYIVFGNL